MSPDLRHLGDCIKLASGGTPSKSDPTLWGGNIPWASGKDLKQLRLADTEDHVTELAIGRGTRLAAPGTILLLVRGMGLLKDAPLSLVQQPMAFNQDLKAITPLGGIDASWLLYWFVMQKPYLMALASEAAHGTKRLEIDRLLGMSIAVPSIEAQRRTGEILTTYDDLIEVNHRRIAILKEMSRRVFDEWFVRFRFPGHQGHAEGKLPASWQQAPIKSAYAGLYDGPHATPPPASDGPVFLGIGNITETGRLDLTTVRHIAEEDFDRWTKRVIPREGDVVFTYEATLNRYALIPNGFRGCLGRRLALIRASSKTGINRYLYLYFFTDAWRAVITKNTLAGATVDRVPLSRFPEFPITLPPDALLSRFDELIEPVFAQIQVLEDSNVRLAASRDLLLPKLISGGIDLSAAGEKNLEFAA